MLLGVEVQRYCSHAPKTKATIENQGLAVFLIKQDAAQVQQEMSSLPYAPYSLENYGKLSAVQFYLVARNAVLDGPGRVGDRQLNCLFGLDCANEVAGFDPCQTFYA